MSHVPSHAPPTLSALDEELRLLCVYRMRDALMQRHAYTEALATEVAVLLLETLAGLSPDELLEAQRRVRGLQRARRDAAIRAAMRPGNADQLAKQFGISRRAVYKIAARRGAALGQVKP
jgi:hypothetical protein